LIAVGVVLFSAIVEPFSAVDQQAMEISHTFALMELFPSPMGAALIAASVQLSVARGGWTSSAPMVAFA